MRECNCDTCSAWFNPLPFDEDQGENSEPIAFSKSACEAGNSEQCHLAGERYIEHELDDEGDLIHLELCADCYLKFHGVFEEVVA